MKIPSGGFQSVALLRIIGILGSDETNGLSRTVGTTDKGCGMSQAYLTLRKGVIVYALKNAYSIQSLTFFRVYRHSTCGALLFFLLIFINGSLCHLNAQEQGRRPKASNANEVQPALALESSNSNPVVGASSEIRVAKPIISSTGLTQVGLESGLGRIAKGAEPQSVDELLALESQQAKVADRLPRISRLLLPFCPPVN